MSKTAPISPAVGESFMDVHEAAAYLHVSPGTLRRWTQRKVIPHFKLGRRLVRYSRQNLDAYLQTCGVEAKTSPEATR